MSDAIDALWTPFELGDVRLRNRVFVSAHTTNFGKGNLPTRRHVDYHRERARGGVGLIITEALRVHPTAAARDESIGVFDDSCIPTLAAVVDAVHGQGCAIFGQVLHIGRQANGGLARTAQWGASAIPWKVGAPVPHVMDDHEIRLLVDSFGAGARRAFAAGMDGLEVHLGHGHLLAQFLSPASNTRTDRWGGDRQGRMRFPREVLDRVLSVADGRPVGIRISAEEFLPDGLSSSGAGAEDILAVTRALLEEFPLAFVNVSHSAYVGQWSLSTQIADMAFETAHFRSLPARVKAAVDVPVMAICRMDTIETAADVIASGEADLVGLTRAHIADPRLVAKARGLDPLPVRHCIACNQGCIGRIEQNLPMSCVVNPEVGFEGEWQRWRASTPPPAPRRVLVVGGGPTGLKAAVTAAERGHDVQLVDAAEQLGGLITTAAAALDGRDRFGLLVDDLVAEAHARGVQITTGATVAVDDVLADPPDAVVVATGSLPPTPAEAHADLLAAIRDPAQLGERIVVVDTDGTWAGAGTALHLARHGAEVHLVAPVPGLAWNVTTYSWLNLIRMLGEAGVVARPLRQLVRWDGPGAAAVLADVLTGSEEELGAVTGVVEVGPRAARDDLATALLSSGFRGDVVVAGDAYAPRTALEAVYEGQLAGVLAGGETPPVLTDPGLPPYALRAVAPGADRDVEEPRTP